MPPPIEFGHSTWNAASTTTRPRRPDSSSGRSVLNQVCTSSSGAYVEVVMNGARAGEPTGGNCPWLVFLIDAGTRVLCARSRHQLQEADEGAGECVEILANSPAMS